MATDQSKPAGLSGPEAALRQAGLRHTQPDELSLSRRRCGRGFVYHDAAGRRVSDLRVIERIRGLAVPPDYRNVRIAADPSAHLQAIGEDAAGRLQYRYHPDWETVREIGKVQRLALMARAIPRIRRRVAQDLRGDVGSREQALAAVVALIDHTHIRIGGEDYVHSGRSRGACTLLKRHVRCQGDTITLAFPGKGGREVACSIESAELSAAVCGLAALPGRRLFQYRNSDGRLRRITAGDVNLYLREVAGAPVTAKDFRTLAATATAGLKLARIPPAETQTARRRQIAAVMKEVAELLGNTPAVARRSYVHKELVEAFLEGRLLRLYAGARGGGRRKGEALIAAIFDATASKPSVQERRRVARSLSVA
jgi:DNA topoisomerase I